MFCLCKPLIPIPNSEDTCYIQEAMWCALVGHWQRRWIVVFASKQDYVLDLAAMGDVCSSLHNGGINISSYVAPKK